MTLICVFFLSLWQLLWEAHLSCNFRRESMWLCTCHWRLCLLLPCIWAGYSMGTASSSSWIWLYVNISTNIITTCIYTDVTTVPGGPTSSDPEIVPPFVFCCVRARRVWYIGCGHVYHSLSEARIAILTFAESQSMGGTETSFHPFEKDFLPN